MSTCLPCSIIGDLFFPSKEKKNATKMRQGWRSGGFEKISKMNIDNAFPIMVALMGVEEAS